MKKISLFFMLFMVMLIAAGCSDSDTASESDAPTEGEEGGTPITIPEYSISDEYYQFVLPYTPSEARGLSVSNMDNMEDISTMEEGLMRISQEYYPTDEYYFSEGQYLDAETTEKLLSREMTPEQLEAEELTEADNIGLNPVSPNGDESVPMYISHIVEQDYLVVDENGTATTGGITIGLAMNSVYYYDDPKTGYKKEVEIKDETLISEGKRMAEEILDYIRTIEGLEEVPVTFAIYKQADANSVTPGNFVAVGTAGKGSDNVSDWTSIDEKYYLFPSDAANADHPGDNAAFLNFQKAIEDFFPNHTGIIGTGFYQDGKLVAVEIDIQMQFYSHSEVVSFTQFVAGEALKIYPDDIALEINISSSLGQESVIVREPGQEPFIHIY